MTEKETQTEKENDDMNKVGTAMITLAMIFLVVGGAGILAGAGLGYWFGQIGVSVTYFDSMLIMMMSIFLVIVGCILWWYAPGE